MRRTVSGALCGALVAAMMAMVGCGSTAQHASNLVTPDQAKAVALAYLQKPYYTQQVPYEAGGLRALNRAAVITSPIPKPEPTQDTRLTHNVTVFVPRQTSYPATFLCYDGIAAFGRLQVPELIVFSKPDASSPWTVTSQLVQIATTTAPDVALDSAGYAQIIPSSRYGAFMVSPAQVGTDYGAYLRASDSTDAREFGPGGMTSQFVEGQNKAIRAFAQTGLTLSYSFAPTGDPVVAYLLNDGGALVTTALRSSRHEVATKDPIVVKDDGKGVNGPTPGKYRDITTENLFLLAFTVPAKGSPDKVTGLAEQIGSIQSTGTKA